MRIFIILYRKSLRGIKSTYSYGTDPFFRSNFLCEGMGLRIERIKGYYILSIFTVNEPPFPLFQLSSVQTLVVDQVYGIGLSVCESIFY